MKQIRSPIISAIAKSMMVLLGILIFPWASITIGIIMTPNPPKPEITYGEFPFKLVYEINGEQFVVEDVVVCEYDGVGMNEAVGKYRKWKSYLKSNGKENIVLLDLGDDNSIIYPTGSVKYYMGDKDTEHYLFPNAVMMRRNGYGIIRADELKSEYSIVLISWEPSPPIENSFN